MVGTAGQTSISPTVKITIAVRYIGNCLALRSTPNETIKIQKPMTICAQMVIGFCIFIVSFGVLLSAKQFPMYLTAMVILTVGEMLVWPAVPTIANQLG